MLISAIAALALQGLSARPADLAQPAEAPAYAQSVHDAALQLAAARNGQPCPAEATVASLGVLRLGAAGRVVGVVKETDPVAADAGVYKERVRVEGCGPAQRQDNILTVRQKAGGWIALAMLPGDSLTTPLQQHDALRSAVQITQVADPKPVCDAGQPPYLLVDTFVTDTAKLREGVWSERWVQRACGQDRTVNIHFMPRPDGKATSLVVEQGWPVANPPSRR